MLVILSSRPLKISSATEEHGFSGNHTHYRWIARPVVPGFAFVEMTNDAEANAAMTALNGKNFDGRDLTVNEARPREGGGGGGGRAASAAAAVVAAAAVAGGFLGGRWRGGGGRGSGGGRGGW